MNMLIFPWSGEREGFFVAFVVCYLLYSSLLLFLIRIVGTFNIVFIAIFFFLNKFLFARNFMGEMYRSF